MRVILFDKGPVLMGRVVTSHSHPIFDLAAANSVELFPCSHHCPFPVLAFSSPPLIWRERESTSWSSCFLPHRIFPTPEYTLPRPAGWKVPEFYGSSCTARCFGIADNAGADRIHPSVPAPALKTLHRSTSGFCVVTVHFISFSRERLLFHGR